MAYCSVEDVRAITGLEASDLSDDEITQLINYAVIQLNRDVLIDRTEQIVYLDNTRKNTIDGSNTEFYVAYPYIGDLNNDGIVDEQDVEVWYVDSEGNRTDCTVTSINAKLGKFVLDSAPPIGCRLFVHYRESCLLSNHSDLKLANALLASAYCYLKISPKNISKIGKISFKLGEGFNQYYEKYKQLVTKIVRWYYV